MSEYILACLIYFIAVSTINHIEENDDDWLSLANRSILWPFEILHFVWISVLKRLEAKQ